MASGALALLGVMFVDWYETPQLVLRGAIDVATGELHFNAWQAFAVNDVILAVAALLALVAVIVTALHPTPAAPIALASLATLVALIAWVLVAIRLIWPPALHPFEGVDVSRLAGAWLGLAATAVLTAGCLASIRNERVPRPKRPVEPRLVEP